jgi:tetratricopeptide (TPR) repeat protein
VEALKVTLGTEVAVDSKITADSAAYNHYLKGRFFWHQRNPDAFVSAERELQQATTIDPSFAKAWSALADVYVLLPEYSGQSVDEVIPKARAAAERALSLDPDLAPAVTTRAYIKALYDWDSAGAEADYKRAIEIDPGYATAYQWYSEALAAYRRKEESRAFAARAYELDPLAPIKPVVLGNTLREMERFDEAVVYYDQALELVPGFAAALVHKANTRLLQGHYDEARALYTEFAAAVGRDVEQIDYVLATIDSLMGKMPVAEAIRVVMTSKNTNCSAVDKPMYLAILGAYELAITTLGECIDGGDPYAIQANVIVPYEPMRKMPEFQSLLRRMNLWEDE